MEIVLFDEETVESTHQNGKALIAIRSLTSSECLSELTQTLHFKSDITDCGNKALKMYNSALPDVIVLDLNLPNLSGLELIHAIGENNVKRQHLSRIIVISHDTSRTTVSKLLLAVKAYRGHIKLGFMAKPWKVQDFYRQLRNLHSDNTALLEDIDAQLDRFDSTEEGQPIVESRLVLGVTEIEKGLRVELGCDREISVNSTTVQSYIQHIEKNLLCAPVSYIEFSLSALTRVPPQNIIALLLLLHGLSGKWDKKIAFVEVPFGLYTMIKEHGLGHLIRQ